MLDSCFRRLYYSGNCLEYALCASTARTNLTIGRRFSFRRTIMCHLTLPDHMTSAGCSIRSSIQPFAIFHNFMSTRTAFRYDSSNVATILGRSIPPFSTDHVGPVNGFLFAHLCSCFLAFSRVAVDSEADLSTFATFYGLFMADGEACPL